MDREGRWKARKREQDDRQAARSQGAQEAKSPGDSKLLTGGSGKPGSRGLFQDRDGLTASQQDPAL